MDRARRAVAAARIPVWVYAERLERPGSPIGGRTSSEERKDEEEHDLPVVRP
jgi:hypothetical protein